ncbi:MAG: NAD(P)H-dependent oxidoreductase subunit E [Spirochaetaceae bacterium]
MDLPSTITRYTPRKENILLMFHALQEEHRESSYIPTEDIAAVGKYLNMSMSEVEGVLTFYQAFSRTPRGRYVLRLCDSLSCRICGSLDLYHYLRKRLGIQKGETTGDGLFTLELVNCLGCCDTAPNIMINDTLMPIHTVEELDAALQELTEGGAYEGE